MYLIQILLPLVDDKETSSKLFSEVAANSHRALAASPYIATLPQKACGTTAEIWTGTLLSSQR
jgi:hypothetical protein